MSGGSLDFRAFGFSGGKLWVLRFSAPQGFRLCRFRCFRVLDFRVLGCSGVRSRSFAISDVLGLRRTQRAQYPLIKEYSLNHNMKPCII